jgi:hypothetical protein
MEKMMLKIDCEGYMILCCHDCLICTRLWETHGWSAGFGLLAIGTHKISWF